MSPYYIKANINYFAKDRKNVFVRIQCYAHNQPHAEQIAIETINKWSGIEDFQIMKVTTEYFDLFVFYVGMAVKYRNGTIADLTFHVRAEDELEAEAVAHNIIGSWRNVVSTQINFISK